MCNNRRRRPDRLASRRQRRLHHRHQRLHQQNQIHHQHLTHRPQRHPPQPTGNNSSSSNNNAANVAMEWTKIRTMKTATANATAMTVVATVVVVVAIGGVCCRRCDSRHAKNATSRWPALVALATMAVLLIWLTRPTSTLSWNVSPSEVSFPVVASRFGESCFDACKRVDMMCQASYFPVLERLQAITSAARLR
jgi:hypothetical protein